MNTKFVFCFIVLWSMCCSVALAQQKISILGDSYSTFGGYLSPSTNLAWYNGTDGGGKDKEQHNDVRTVEQTWWYRFIHKGGYQLERNNSYSGSTVCLTGYRQEDFSDRAFITRIHNLGNPDIILVFGGTNDSWAHSPIGEYQYKEWTRHDLFSFRPAFAYLMYNLRQLYPNARIYNLTNSELSAAITESMEEICLYYQVPNIRLHDIDKQWGHPSIRGMESICEQLEEVIGD